MTAACTPHRRAAAMLLAVVVLVASATLAATGLIVTGTSRDLSVKTETLVAESRSTARGLVSAVQAELDSQLEDLVAGERPDLGEATSWLSTEGSQQWVARVVREGSWLDADSMIHSEAGKLNLNTMPESVLLALDSLPADAANAIVQGRPFASVRDAVSAAGAGMSDAWVPLVTVYSSDPPRSSGLALDAGAQRLRMPAGSDPAPDRPAFVAESAYDPFAAEQRPRSVAELYHQCVDNNLAVGPTGRMLDLVAFSDRPRVGLLDINTAPAECLAALPGLTPGIAEELVDTRSRLSAAELSPLNWPVREFVLTTAQLEAVLPLITTRSLQWSLRIEAGLAVGEDGDVSAAALEYPVRHALVIDTSGEGSRVVMIRDETNASAAVPPSLRPVVEDSAATLLSERAAAQPRPAPSRPAQSRGRTQPSAQPSPTSPDTGAGASAVRRDRAGGAP
ncbi:MAG: DNA uptake protein ComE-like DNA-binding protein [Phycisphaerales bacterium]|jgi:DNA uptake protein ComE-like DNA-binding protein